MFAWRAHGRRIAKAESDLATLRSRLAEVGAELQAERTARLALEAELARVARVLAGHTDLREQVARIAEGVRTDAEQRRAEFDRVEAAAARGAEAIATARTALLRLDLQLADHIEETRKQTIGLLVRIEAQRIRRDEREV